MIELINIKKKYVSGDLSFEALKGIHLTIKENDYIALMGTSGSGKSTLMNILGALDTPTYGEYILYGKPIHLLDNDKISEFRNKEIGFIFQSFNLLPKLSVLDNVILPLIYTKEEFSKKEREQKAIEVLNKVGLGDKLTNKPNELSGGQRQRVAIARALINEPKILLADEPTGNLDSKTSYEIMQLFDDLHNSGQTIILVTHENDIAKFAKKIITLKDGLITN